MGYFIGIDIGTSSTKTVLLDGNGQIVSSSSKAYACEHPHSGWSEQNPEDWFEAAVETIQDIVCDACVDPNSVAGLSFGGQMHGLVILDDKDNIIRPAILWNDGRSVKETEFLNNDIGRDVLTARCGNIAFPGFTAPKLLWLKQHEPDSFARISKVMLPKDYVAYRMTGVFCTDVSDASGTLFFDVRNREWSVPMLQLLGITREQLPRIFESSEVVGTLLPSVASRMGLSKRVLVVAGAGDNEAAAVGMDCVHDGQCNISIGTSGTVFLPTSSMLLDGVNSLHSFCDATGSYHLMGCILSAASANEWWIENILESDYVREEPSREEMSESSVVFLPYLMGERSPINDAAARGAFIGMDINTTREEMGRAVLEGVAFALRQSLDAALGMGAEVSYITLCGGGSRSEAWRQIIADVLNMPLAALDQERGPGYGAAILAMVGCGLYPSVEVAADALAPAISGMVIPNSLQASSCQHRYEIYRLLYPALKNVYAVLSKVSK